MKKYQSLKIDQRNRGYGKFPKGIFLLLSKNTLNNSEFILYIYCLINLVDWDINHKETYGTFDFTLKQIGYGLGWNYSTVGKILKKLQQFKLITYQESIYKVNKFEEINSRMKGKQVGLIDILEIINHPTSFSKNTQEDEDLKTYLEKHPITELPKQ